MPLMPHPSRVVLWMAALVVALPSVSAAEVTSVLFGATSAPFADSPVPTSSLALESPALTGDEELLAARISGDTPRAPKPPKPGRRSKERAPRPPRNAPAVLDAHRASLLLRSLTLPGWGQASAGRRTSSKVFLAAEAGVWGSFTAFRIQQVMRRQTYERTARIYAGVDLRGRDEEYRRTVGSFLSSDEYNQLVVFRDAANLHYNDPAAYRAYIAEHSIGGKDAWSWGSVADLLRYRGERKNEQRAGLRANTALALAVANRLVSMIHAARVAGRPVATQHTWHLECVPAGENDPTAYHLQLRTGF